MFKVFYFICSLFICACTYEADKTRPRQNTPVQWQFLSLELNDTVIQLVRSFDYLEIVTSQNESQKYPINKVEKDSLFIWANELMEYNEQPKLFCTDYINKLKVKIRYNSQLLKEVSFSSICNWRELDSNTNRIDKLLNKVFHTNR